jgi:hypothetical protein
MKRGETTSCGRFLGAKEECWVSGKKTTAHALKKRSVQAQPDLQGEKMADQKDFVTRRIKVRQMAARGRRRIGFHPPVDADIHSVHNLAKVE